MAEAVAQHAITPAMGSSLVNDSAFARDIALNLIQAAQTLYASADRDEFEAAQDVVLDKTDVDRLSGHEDLKSA